MERSEHGYAGLASERFLPADRLSGSIPRALPEAARPIQTGAVENRVSPRAQEYRRGWRVLLASALGAGVGVAPIASYSLGAFVAPLAQEFGWSRADVTAAALFKSIGVMAMGTLVGGLADRFGARVVALSSQLLLGLGLAALALIDGRLWTLYLGFTGIAIVGAGTLPMIWSRAVVGWFVTSRGLALGLSLAGTGIVGALLPSYVGLIVPWLGWRGAFLGIAALPLAIGFPAALLWFREPPRTLAERGVDGALIAIAPETGYAFRDAIRTWCFWQMALAFVTVSVAVSGVLVHALPLMTDRGIDARTGAAIAGLFGLAVVVGRLISGYFIDRFRGPFVAAATFALTGGACAMLLFAGSSISLSVIAITLVGLSAGAESDVAGFLTARYFGRRHYGAIYGLLYTLFGLGNGAGPYLVGLAFDRHGNYDLALEAGCAIFVVAALLIGTLRPPVASRP